MVLANVNNSYRDQDHPTRTGGADLAKFNEQIRNNRNQIGNEVRFHVLDFGVKIGFPPQRGVFFSFDASPLKNINEFDQNIL